MVRALTAVLLAWGMVCPEVPAQTPVPKQSGPVDPRGMVKPDPKRAQRLAELGSKEEAAGQYTEALAAYEEAARYAPFDVTIVNLSVSLRSRLVRGYMDDAEQRAIAGDLDGATQQLATALHLDPTNTIVQERLQQMELMKGDSKSQPPAQEPPIGMPELKPDRTRQNFRITADLRTVYEQVAAAYGLKASFDPDLATRTVKLRLEDVDFETAMKVLTAQTGTFWHALNSKLIFVAADTAEKRRAYEPQIEQTFYLPGSTNATEMAEVVRAVRDLTGAQRVQQSANAHSVTIRDTVPKVRLAGAIIDSLEKSPGEVLLEIDLLEVDRDNAAKMGITPPASVSVYSVSPALASQLRSATSITALLTILASVFGTAASGGLTSLASAIPPIAAIGGGKSTFLLALPTFSGDFSESLSLVRSGRQVLLRAQDGKPATFFVGERYPVTLSLLSASEGGINVQTPSVGGTGTSVQSEQFTVGQGPVSMAVADFRNAGTQDLAVLNEIDNSVSILLNQGANATSQFAAPSGSPISLGAARTQTPAVPAAIVTGSVNSATDSLPDLLVTDPVANTVTVLLENTAGDGTFTIQPNPIAVGNEPSAIVAGTFNSNTNSNLGFAVTNFADNTISVFNGNGDGTFTQVTGSPFALPATATGPIAVTAADFNNDGILDLAVLNQTTKNVTILQGKGDGTFAQFPNSPVAVGNGAVAIASGTLAGSTGPALAIANQADNTVTVYLGNGDGTFAPSSQSPLATDKAPTGIAISDFAEQATGGIAVTNRDAGTVTVFVDLGSGLFTSALEPAAGTSPTAIASGAFTGNALPDIVVTNNIASAAGQVTLLISPTSLVASSSIAQTPYPGSEYVDIGLKIKTTPTLHENKEVTLQMEFEIKSISGTVVNQIPIISNRSMTQVVRLKENETSIVSGLLNLQETRTITGIPGLAKLPRLGYAFGVHNDTSTNDELLILITPRRVRAPVRESQSFYAGRGELGGGRSSLGGGAAGAPVVPAPEGPQPTEAPAEGPPPAQQPPAAPPPTPAPEQEQPQQDNEQRQPPQQPQPPPPQRPEPQ